MAKDLSQFDPNGIGHKDANIFGLPFTCEEAKVVIIPVPWEVTVSYGAGTAKGPETVFAASSQLDLFDPDCPNGWQAGIAMQAISPYWQAQSQTLREQAAEYIDFLANRDDSTPASEHLTAVAEAVNRASLELNYWVKTEASKLLAQGKLVGVLGGDHSVPLGLMQALAEQYSEYSILHIDAHADLRVAYEGFQFSHASIMDNTLNLPQVKRLVQVGIRDICHAEMERIMDSHQRIIPFYDWDLKERQFVGKPWHQTCEEIIAPLSDAVYVSFDIDGLEPSFCPNTGTPVPGGLRFEEACYLLKRLADSGKKIIGFDLCEVASGDDDWDGNVGARVLYKLINSMIRSQQLDVSPVSSFSY